MSLQSILVFLSLLGALDSLYTALQQKFPRLFQLCFTINIKRVNCYQILHSKYSKIFLIPNSWLGIFFYTLLALIYSNIIILKIPLFAPIISSLALTFSLYLLYNQAKVLKTCCIFCLLSTLIITIITILSWLLAYK